MFSFFKKRFITTIIIIVFIVVGGGILLFRGDNAPAVDFSAVERRGLLQEVSVTGNVEAAHAVSLAFERTGRVSRIYAGVGDEVFAGEVLVALENSDISAQLRETEAQVKVQQAALDELKIGSRPEEIRSQEIKVENAKVALEDSEKNLMDKVQDGFTKADDSVRNKLDQIFVNPQGENYNIYFTTNNPQFESDIKSARAIIENTLDSWAFSLVGFLIQSDLNTYYDAAKINLTSVRALLDKAALVVNQAQAGTSISQATLDGYKTDIATARTNINTALSNLSSAKEKLQTAGSTLSYEQQQLVIKTAGPTAEALRTQEAKVEQAEAAVAIQQAVFAKTVLRAPLRGIITKQNTEVGQIVTAGTVIVSLISESQYEIKVNIAETDITSVQVGNSARVTLDAYGSDEEFPAHVVILDPAETIVQGVVTYKTTLQFDNKDGRIKSGMTANVDILTAKRENVLVIPSRSIFIDNNQQFVRILKDDGTIEERAIQTGLRGSFGEIEITQGLQEGEKVLTFFTGK